VEGRLTQSPERIEKDRLVLTWQIGIFTDDGGHVHLGALVAGTESERPQYVDLLAPVGACRADELEIEQLLVLVHGELLDDLRQVARQCIADAHLRARLVALLAAQTAGEVRTLVRAEQPAERLVDQAISPRSPR
jgi:hypothetical protein